MHIVSTVPRRQGPLVGMFMIVAIIVSSREEAKQAWCDVEVSCLPRPMTPARGGELLFGSTTLCCAN